MIIKKFHLFEKFVEKKSNTRILYSDKDVVVKVVKTFDASKNLGKETGWCSNEKPGFYNHNITANMYRFIFSDGYKLRLTWDYRTDSERTHWGQGGKLDGEFVEYLYIYPKDNEEPFYFDYTKIDERKPMVDRIQSLPQVVIDVVTKYQESKSYEKTAIHNSYYKEIQKISIKSCSKLGPRDLNVVVYYRGKEFKMRITRFDRENFQVYCTHLLMVFKNKYAYHDGGDLIKKYIFDKSMEFEKKSNI